MIYLLDTNVISETIKKSPNKIVLDWLSAIDINQCALSVLTLGEIRRGAEMLENKQTKYKLIQWLEIDLLKQFYGRIISIDAKVADKWGYICSFMNQSNKILAIDTLIAASAIVHNLKVVTRNTKDFQEIIGLEIINPWDII